MKYRTAFKYLEPCNLNLGTSPPLLHCSPAKGCSKRTRKCSGWNYVSTEHQVPKENTQAAPSKQQQQQCTQNRGLFLRTVPVHLEVLFPSQRCGQKRPLVSQGSHEDFYAFHPTLPPTVCLGNSAPVWLPVCTAAPPHSQTEFLSAAVARVK